MYVIINNLIMSTTCSHYFLLVFIRHLKRKTFRFSRCITHSKYWIRIQLRIRNQNSWSQNERRSKTDIFIHESWLCPYWLSANEYSDATSHLNSMDCLMLFNEIRDIGILNMCHKYYILKTRLLTR